MTTTIKRSDITMVRTLMGDYRLCGPLGPMRTDYPTKADALAAAAERTDERAGAAQVGDIVRIGNGAVEYKVEHLRSGDYSDGCALVRTDYPYTRRPYVPFDRLHVVEAVR